MTAHEHGGPGGAGGTACRDLFARLSDYLDGEIDPADCARIDEHMADCEPCRAFLESLRHTVGLVRLAPGEPISQAWKTGLVEAFERARRGIKKPL